MLLREYKNKAEIALVDLRLNLWPCPIFVTISPNPSVLVPVRRVSSTTGKMLNCKLPYGKLPQRIQYDYCLKVVKTVYNYSADTKYFCTWELNKQGNVHFHLLYCDPLINSDVSMQIFRRDILNHDIVIRNMCKGKKMVDYMNNIVFVNDSIEDRFNYLTKDIHSNIHIFPYFSYNVDLLELPESRIDLAS